MLSVSITHFKDPNLKWGREFVRAGYTQIPSISEGEFPPNQCWHLMHWANRPFSFITFESIVSVHPLENRQWRTEFGADRIFFTYQRLFLFQRSMTTKKIYDIWHALVIFAPKVKATVYLFKVIQSSVLRWTVYSRRIITVQGIYA